MVDLLFKKIQPYSKIPLPQYETKESAGIDLRSREDILIPPHQHRSIKTGIVIQIKGIGVHQVYEMQIRSRSGLAAKHGLRVFQGIGTIDQDYRGEVKVLLENTSESPYQVKRGDRIAQGVINKVEQPQIFEVSYLEETDRGEGGFGSTGKN